MRFEIGQRVVCVNDVPNPRTVWGKYPLVKGRVYVIRDNNVTSPEGIIHCVRLEEIYRYEQQDWPYRENRFEPLQETSIEIFKRMLVSKELEDV